MLVELRCPTSHPTSYPLHQLLTGYKKMVDKNNKTVSVLYHTRLGQAAFSMITAPTVVMTTTLSVAALTKGGGCDVVTRRGAACVGSIHDHSHWRSTASDSLKFLSERELFTPV